MVSINILNDQPSNSTCIIMYEGPTAGVASNMYIYDSESCSVGVFLCLNVVRLKCCQGSTLLCHLSSVVWLLPACF